MQQTSAATAAWAQPGGLPEWVSTGYDSSGNPARLTSNLWPSVAQLSYASIGQPPQPYRMGSTNNPVYTTNTLRPADQQPRRHHHLGHVHAGHHQRLRLVLYYLSAIEFRMNLI